MAGLLDGAGEGAAVILSGPTSRCKQTKVIKMKINGLLIDCGRASKKTQGVTTFPLFELGTPPLNRLFL